MPKKPAKSSQPKPKPQNLSITDYYDDMINIIDLEAEKILPKHDPSEKINQDPRMFVNMNTSSEDEDDDESSVGRGSSVGEIAVRESERDIFGDTCGEANRYRNPYEAKFDYNLKLKSARFDPKKTTIHEYVDKIRCEMIDELTKLKDECVEISGISGNNEDEMKEEMFGKRKFPILIRLEWFMGSQEYEWCENRSPFPYFLLIFESYLNKNILNDLS